MKFPRLAAAIKLLNGASVSFVTTMVDRITPAATEADQEIGADDRGLESARGDPIEALERLIELARTDLAPYTVARELIALRHGGGDRPIIGMFLGGAGLADTMLYCRDKIYPLGLPTGIAHGITAFALLAKWFLKAKASFLPPDPTPLRVSMGGVKNNALTGQFSLLAVTTLEKLLLNSELGGRRNGTLKFLAIEERRASPGRSGARRSAACISRKPTRSPSKAKART